MAGGRYLITAKLGEEGMGFVTPRHRSKVGREVVIRFRARR